MRREQITRPVRRTSRRDRTSPAAAPVACIRRPPGGTDEADDLLARIDALLREATATAAR